MIPYFLVTREEFVKFVTLKENWKSYVHFFTIYSFYGLIAFLFIEYDILGKIRSLSTDNNLKIMLYISTLSFTLMYLLKSIFTKLPDLRDDPLKDKKMDPDFNSRIAILIACHNSEDVINHTLDSALKFFGGDQIFVCDNNRTEQRPNDATKDKCDDKKCNYFYFPKPNKTHALTKGVQKINKNYEYVILLDDDTLFPDNFYLSEDVFADNVGLLAFGLKIKDQNNWVERCVNMEYLLFIYNNYCKNYACVEFACGAAYMMRRNIFEEGMKKNPADGSILPYGEDGLIGLINRYNGYIGKQDLTNWFLTYCPDKLYFGPMEMIFGSKSISGYGAVNLWKQRALRWYRSGAVRLPLEISTIFYLNVAANGDSLVTRITKNLYYKLLIFWGMILAYWAFMFPFVLYANIENMMFYLYIHLILYALAICYGAVNKIFVFSKIPAMHIEWMTIFVFPIFSSYLMILRCVGTFSTLLYFIPINYKIWKIYFCGMYKIDLSIAETKKEIEVIIISIEQSKTLDLELTNPIEAIETEYSQTESTTFYSFSDGYVAEDDIELGFVR